MVWAGAGKTHGRSRVPAGVPRISRPSVGEVHVLLSIDLSVRLRLCLCS